MILIEVKEEGIIPRARKNLDTRIGCSCDRRCSSIRRNRYRDGNNSFQFALEACHGWGHWPVKIHFPITVNGLDINSTQADKAVLKALIDCGCILSVRDKQIEIGPASLKAFHFNATDCPDLFPPLVTLACYCNGTTVIEGVSRLLHKESNRAKTLQEEFGKMGVEIQLQDDLMLIKGGLGVKGAKVLSHHDHRIAMACSIAALRAEGPTIIEDAEAINKSYPGFYDQLQDVGVILNSNQ